MKKAAVMLARGGIVYRRGSHFDQKKVKFHPRYLCGVRCRIFLSKHIFRATVKKTFERGFYCEPSVFGASLKLENLIS